MRGRCPDFVSASHGIAGPILAALLSTTHTIVTRAQQLGSREVRSYMTEMEAEVPIPRAKTITFIAIVVITNSFGNLMLAMGMDHMPALSHVPLLHYLLELLANPYVVPGTVLSVVYTLAQLSLFSWADLSYVIPCTAASYIVTTILSQFILGEHVQADRWVGVLLITAGVVLVAETPAKTRTLVKES